MARNHREAIWTSTCIILAVDDYTPFIIVIYIVNDQYENDVV